MTNWITQFIPLMMFLPQLLYAACSAEAHLAGTMPSTGFMDYVTFGTKHGELKTQLAGHLEPDAQVMLVPSVDGLRGIIINKWDSGSSITLAVARPRGPEAKLTVVYDLQIFERVITEGEIDAIIREHNLEGKLSNLGLVSSTHGSGAPTATIDLFAEDDMTEAELRPALSALINRMGKIEVENERLAKTPLFAVR